MNPTQRAELADELLLEYHKLEVMLCLQAERLSKRMELRLKESEEKVSDLDARASIAKQRIAILERELETSRDVQKELQSELAAARAQAAADRQRLQVRGLTDKSICPREDQAYIYLSKYHY